MKVVLFLVAVTVATSCSHSPNGEGTRTETKIYGTVISPSSDFAPFSYSGIMIDENRANGDNVSSAFAVREDGTFVTYVEKRTKINLSTFYENFYDSEVSLQVGNEDSVELHFVALPKTYVYTAEKAELDLCKNIVFLVIHDPILYGWNKKLKYTRQFGFDYILLPEPGDFDFGSNLSKYNFRMEEFISSKDSLWQLKIRWIEDSLINIEADNYAKKYAIDISNLAIPARCALPSETRTKLHEQMEEFHRIFGTDTTEYKAIRVKSMLDSLDTSRDYNNLFIAEYWIAFNYEVVIQELISRITNKKEIGLVNSADLIIDERIFSGDLQSFGHGGVVRDDLFTITGRANRLLKCATGKDFGDVSMYSTDRQLRRIQNRWKYWLMILNSKN